MKCFRALSCPISCRVNAFGSISKTTGLDTLTVAILINPQLNT